LLPGSRWLGVRSTTSVLPLHQKRSRVVRPRLDEDAWFSEPRPNGPLVVVLADCPTSSFRLASTISFYDDGLLCKDLGWRVLQTEAHPPTAMTSILPNLNACNRRAEVSLEQIFSRSGIFASLPPAPSTMPSGIAQPELPSCRGIFRQCPPSSVTACADQPREPTSSGPNSSGRQKPLRERQLTCVEVLELEARGQRATVYCSKWSHSIVRI